MQSTPRRTRATLAMLAVLVIGNLVVIFAWPSHCADHPHLAIGGTIWISGCSEH
ncbi:hypothetical protein ACQR16_16920 [Bradyrhizobium oligotrophicum]|uniref:hypothetical protein n=1 Tax=Bradyrhizobium oligotrophicum TaxID=44255 RepID=UPI003EBCB06D